MQEYTNSYKFHTLGKLASGGKDNVFMVQESHTESPKSPAANCQTLTGAFQLQTSLRVQTVFTASEKMCQKCVSNKNIKPLCLRKRLD